MDDEADVLQNIRIEFLPKLITEINIPIFPVWLLVYLLNILSNLIAKI